MFSVIVSECRKLKIKTNKTGNIKNFLDAMTVLKEERRKAENVFLDEVE